MWAALAEDPSSTQDSSQPPITPVPRELMFSSGLHEHLHISCPNPSPPIKKKNIKSKNNGSTILPWFNEQKTKGI
ncbi:hypothetical protein I79_004001 [Cricetulus griseus]|uniref:Uncharacterized protein n=1 Tax=Cricetulus griseus TaxID=10029 RepID=G3H1H5_CRIGR|nr:hypothetical protein I79_004001 [Cricetulus griseus]